MEAAAHDAGAGRAPHGGSTAVPVGCMEPVAGPCPTPGWGGPRPKPQRHPQTPGWCKPRGVDPRPRSAAPSHTAFLSPAFARGQAGRLQAPHPCRIPKPPRPTARQPARRGSLGTASLKLGPWRQSPEPEQACSLKRKGSATAANPAAGSAGARRPRGGWPAALGCSQERQASHGTGEAGPGWDEHGMRRGAIPGLL